MPLPDAVAALFPGASDRQRIGLWLTQRLEQALTQAQTGRVTPDIDMVEFRAELDGFDFAAPLPLEDALRWTIERMEHGIVQMANPRYFGLFNPGASFPAQCADHIIALFNPQLASSGSSPVPVALESHVIRAVASGARPWAIRRHRPLCHGRFGGELHRADLRVDRRLIKGFLERKGVAGVRRTRSSSTPRKECPHRVAQDCPSRRRRPFSRIESHRHRRQRSKWIPRRCSGARSPRTARQGIRSRS